MKKVLIAVLVMVAMAGFSGCGKKAKENAMSEALEQAATSIEAGSEQGNFLIYEGDEAATASQGVAPVGAQTSAETPMAAFVETNAVAGDTPTNEQIQQALKGAGLYDGTVDGKIGPMTKKAIRKFQIQNDLTVDGKVGKKTWAKMQPFLSNPAASIPGHVSVSGAQPSTDNTY